MDITINATGAVASGFATRPEDLELYVSVTPDEEVNAAHYVGLQMTCSANDTILALVVDAEGEYVCIAPKEIAEFIVELMNKYEGDRLR